MNTSDYQQEFDKIIARKYFDKTLEKIRKEEKLLEKKRKEEELI